jgi:hypothetical protein
MYHNNQHIGNYFEKPTPTVSTTTTISGTEELAASKWAMWASQEGEDKSKAVHNSSSSTTTTTSTASSVDLHTSPKLSSNHHRSISPFQKTQLYPHVDHTTSQPSTTKLPQQHMTVEQANELQQRKAFHSHSSSGFKPTEEQLAIVSSDPPLCFCKKPAHRSCTLEYGPILECSSFSVDPFSSSNDEVNKKKNMYTCGFHVHEISWNKFRQTLQRGETIYAEYAELRACPLYNFTFCTMFYITNHFDKVPPTQLPDCFCKKSVKLLETKSHSSGINKIYFACKNGNVEGAKKCSWKLEAKEVAFPRPKHRLHSYVDLEAYHDYLDQVIKNKSAESVVLASIISVSPKQATAQAVPAAIQAPKPMNKTQHHHDLLATLSAPHHPTPTNEMIDFELLQSFSINSPAATADETGDTVKKEKLSSPQPSSLVVPTSVPVKKQQHNHQQQPTLSLSTSSVSSVSSFITSSSTTTPINNHHSHSHHSSTTTTNNKDRMAFDLEEVRILNTALRLKMSETKQEANLRIEEMQQKVYQCQERLSRVQLDCLERINHMRLELEEETLLRLSSQERLSSIELDVVNLINEKEKVTEELASFRELTRTKYGKEEEFNKCKVCFHRTIEYVLIPCYHFGKFPGLVQGVCRVWI